METTILKTENEVVSKFIIGVTLIDPIIAIIEKLEKGEFRNIDMEYLDTKLEHFTSFACKILNIDFPSLTIENDRIGRIMNDHIRKIYIERFTILLKYFESL